MWENFRNAFNETRAVDNSCSEGEGNIAQPARAKKGRARGLGTSPRLFEFRLFKHGAILYNEAEVFSPSITNPNGRPMLPFDWLIH